MGVRDEVPAAIFLALLGAGASAWHITEGTAWPRIVLWVGLVGLVVVGAAGSVSLWQLALAQKRTTATRGPL